MLSQTALRTIASPQGVRLLLLEKLDITQSYKMRRRVITRPFALRGCSLLLFHFTLPHIPVCACAPACAWALGLRRRRPRFADGVHVQGAGL